MGSPCVSPENREAEAKPDDEGSEMDVAAPAPPKGPPCAPPKRDDSAPGSPPREADDAVSCGWGGGCCEARIRCSIFSAFSFAEGSEVMPMESRPVAPPPPAADDDPAPATEFDINKEGDVEVTPMPAVIPLAVLLPLLLVLRKLVLWCVLRPSEFDPDRAAPAPAPMPIDPPVPPDVTAATLPGSANIPPFWPAVTLSEPGKARATAVAAGPGAAAAFALLPEVENEEDEEDENEDAGPGIPCCEGEMIIGSAPCAVKGPVRPEIPSGEDNTEAAGISSEEEELDTRRKGWGLVVAAGGAASTGGAARMDTAGTAAIGLNPRENIEACGCPIGPPGVVAVLPVGEGCSMDASEGGGPAVTRAGGAIPEDEENVGTGSAALEAMPAAEPFIISSASDHEKERCLRPMAPAEPGAGIAP